MTLFNYIYEGGTVLRVTTNKKYHLFSSKMILIGILPGLLLFVVFRLIPSIATFCFSFTDVSTVVGQELHFVGLENYKEILFKNNQRDIIQAFNRTIIFSVSTTVIQTIISLFLAVILCRKFVKGRNLFSAIIFLPTILGMTVTGLCFRLFFSTDGIAASVLRFFGTSSNFFGDYNDAFKLVIFCQIWASLGYEMMLFITGLKNISEDLYEAAAIDGANERSTFWNITLPQLWPTVMVNLLICIIGSLSAFQIIMVTTNGSATTRTLSMLVYQIAFSIGANDVNAGRQGLASAIQMILFIIILVATVGSQFIMNKYSSED
jgi:raffinose/stachyose/melibiose transport system permease protein